MTNEEFMKQVKSFEKKLEKNTFIKSNSVEMVTLDSPQMNFALGGGVVLGHVHNLRGPESAGKTSVATYICGQLQKKVPLMSLNGEEPNPDKNKVLYLDFERTFRHDHAADLGMLVDPEHLIHVRPSNMEEGFMLAEEFIKSDLLCAVVFDSDAMAPTRTQAVDEYGKADFGAGAKSMTAGLKKLCVHLDRYLTPMFIISQERANMNPMGHLPGDTACHMTKFASSTRGRITCLEKIGTEGIILRYRNMKNKDGIPWRDAVMKLYFDGGFRTDEEYVDFLVSLEIVKSGGAWITVPAEIAKDGVEFKLNGKKKLEEYCRQPENREWYEKMQDRVNRLLKGETILDANNTELKDEDDGLTDDQVALKIAAEKAMTGEDLASQALGEE